MILDLKEKISDLGEVVSLTPNNVNTGFTEGVILFLFKEYKNSMGSKKT